MTIVERMQSFLIIAAHDDRLLTTHICVYFSLCAIEAQSPYTAFAISRRKIMRSCKIRGLATYHKCMRDLHQYGYITYVPSYHPLRGSQVILNELSSLLSR